MKTEQQLIQESWDVQNACNLMGVVLAWGRALEDLSTILRNENRLSTEARNQHIVCKLYASKVMSLTGDLPFDLSPFNIKF